MLNKVRSSNTEYENFTRKKSINRNHSAEDTVTELKNSIKAQLEQAEEKNRKFKTVLWNSFN